MSSSRSDGSGEDARSDSDVEMRRADSDDEEAKVNIANKSKFKCKVSCSV